MLTQQIAEAIHAKVGTLVNQSLSLVDGDGQILVSNDPQAGSSLIVEDYPNAISISHNGRVTGYVVLAREVPNYDEISPLIRSIAELMMHQALLIEQLPHHEEQLDKFVYDLLTSSNLDQPTLLAEARLHNLDLTQPRICIVIYVDDPVLTGETPDDSNREMLITRYKFGINRGLESYYTSSRNNIIAYLGHNSFCILKDLSGPQDEMPLEDALDRFKKSINTIYTIFRSELKQPTTVGIGNYHPGIEGLRKSYQEAVSAIELGSQNWYKNRVYHIDDFGVVAPLLSGIDESNIYFSRELLDRLGQSEGIIQTLESFFTHNMGLTQTANELGIHRNTLVYRLDRIAETLQLDPRNFDDAVQIKLAILFNRFVEH